MKGNSLFTAAARQQLSSIRQQPAYTKIFNGYTLYLHCIRESLWAIIEWPGGVKIASRLAFSPGDELSLQAVKKASDEVVLSISAAIGEYQVTISFPGNNQPLIHFTSRLVPAFPLSIPYWPRDIVILNKQGTNQVPEGKIHAKQKGIRSGMVYCSFLDPSAGSILYMQNFTALNEYFQLTHTSAADTVGGEWPDIGFALPPNDQYPLSPACSIVISDAYLLLDAGVPADELDMAEQFLHLLGGIYPFLPKPVTVYHDWPCIVKRTTEHLETSTDCWAQINGHTYLNAYVKDEATPPEIMVQLAVLSPMMDYTEWSHEQLIAAELIKGNLDTFYDNKIKGLVRWLPAAEKQLKGQEEHKLPRVMDSWYLHHPLLNLVRMAIRGQEISSRLMYDSLDYAIKVARHFNYSWPVFYNVDTLEIIKAETAPGEGGEKDVAGIYALVMLEAWELTKEEKYIEEAKKAARSLQGKGFGLFYQANNTAFSAKAMLRLWQQTGNKLYLRLSYLCLANIFVNVALWDCNYGYGKYYPNFFAVFPLSTAPYTAVYEEQEVFASFHDYLARAKGETLIPAVNILLPEFIRYLLHRGIYYYPPLLPLAMLSAESTSGELNPRLWIPLEDLRDGWEKAGAVGQEIYGAGLAFSVVPRHYWKSPDGKFTVFIEYPANQCTANNLEWLLKIEGDQRFQCRMVVTPTDKKPVNGLQVAVNDRKISGVQTDEGHYHYEVTGGTLVQFTWKTASAINPKE